MIVRRLVRLCIRLVIMLPIFGGGADCSGDTRLLRRIWMRHGGNEGWVLSWKGKLGLWSEEKEYGYEPECGKRDEWFSPIQFLHNSAKD